MHILLAQFYSTQTTPEYDRIAAGLRKLGHTVWTSRPTQSGGIEWSDDRRVIATQEAPPAVAWLPKALANRVARVRQLSAMRHFIRDVKPDIVQVNAGQMYRLMPIGMPRDIHFILDVRQINELYGTTPLGRVKAWLKNKSRIIYSRWIFEQTCFLHEAGARQVLGNNWRRWATIVPMGVDNQFFEAAANGANGHHRVDFIYIGRLTLRRQLERIIDAARIVEETTDNFRVVFLGFDDSDGHYRALIQQDGLEDNVVIEPPIPYEQVPQAVLSHDVTLAYVPELPADWQYHPTLKVLEYRALGMPIIASDFVVNRELVADGVNGLLVENTPDSIARAMTRFVTDREFLATCRANAAAMRSGLTWDEAAAQYEQLVYQPLVESGGAT